MKFKIERQAVDGIDVVKMVMTDDQKKPVLARGISARLAGDAEYIEAVKVAMRKEHEGRVSENKPIVETWV